MHGAKRVRFQGDILGDSPKIAFGNLKPLGDASKIRDDSKTLGDSLSAFLLPLDSWDDNLIGGVDCISIVQVLFVLSNPLQNQVCMLP